MKAKIEKTGLAHLAHHNQHWEYCWGYQERVDYILEYKPLEEQETRLRWLVVIPPEMTPGIFSPEWKACGKSGEAYGEARKACVKAWKISDKAWKAYGKDWKAYDKARKACDKAGESYDKARESLVKAEEAYTSKFAKELEELHKEMFPDCPWNGETMFPKKG